MPKYWAYFYWVAVFLSVCSRPSGRAKWTPRSTHKHRHAHTHSRDTQTAAACYGKSNESSLSFSHRSVMWPTNVRWFPSTSSIVETAWIFLLLSTGERMSAIGPVVLASRLLLAPLQQPLGIDLVAFVWFLKFDFLFLSFIYFKIIFVNYHSSRSDWNSQCIVTITCPLFLLKIF